VRGPDESARIARRIRRRTEADADRIAAEISNAPAPITDEELEGALDFARRVGAAPWLIRLLEANRRRDDAVG
jgi:hypothetical protein